MGSGNHLDVQLGVSRDTLSSRDESVQIRDENGDAIPYWNGSTAKSVSVGLTREFNSSTPLFRPTLGTRGTLHLFSKRSFVDVFGEDYFATDDTSDDCGFAGISDCEDVTDESPAATEHMSTNRFSLQGQLGFRSYIGGERLSFGPQVYLGLSRFIGGKAMMRPRQSQNDLYGASDLIWQFDAGIDLELTAKVTDRLAIAARVGMGSNPIVFDHSTSTTYFHDGATEQHAYVGASFALGKTGALPLADTTPEPTLPEISFATRDLIALIPLYSELLRIENSPVPTIWGRKEFSAEQVAELQSRAQFILDHPEILHVVITGVADQGTADYATWRRQNGSQIVIDYFNAHKAPDDLRTADTLFSTNEFTYSDTQSSDLTHSLVGVDFKFTVGGTPIRRDIDMIENTLIPLIRTYAGTQPTTQEQRMQADQIEAALLSLSPISQKPVIERIQSSFVEAGYPTEDVLLTKVATILAMIQRNSEPELEPLLEETAQGSLILEAMVP